MTSMLVFRAEKRSAHSLSQAQGGLLFVVGTLSRVIKVYQEMYKNSHVMPCIAMSCRV